MSKPQDIRQDVWDKAMSFLEASPMVSIPCTSDDRCHLINDPQTAIARAILAAKAEEREACAVVAEMGHWEHRTEGNFHTGHSYAVWCGPTGPMIAAAIRKRGER